MELPLEDDTWTVRTEPSPYVLQLERKLEELRGLVLTMHAVLVENGLIPFNRDQDQPNPPEGRVEDTPESNGTDDKRGREDETPPEDVGRDPPPLILEKGGINDELNTTESRSLSRATFWDRSPMPRQKRTGYKDLVVGKRSSSSPSQPPRKKAKLSTSNKGRRNRNQQPISKEARTCITCGEIFPNLSLHCTRFRPRHGKFCRRANKYFNSAVTWASHLPKCPCSYQHHQEQVDKEVDDDSQSEQLQCVTCNQLFHDEMALARHCISSKPSHGKWCRRLDRVYNHKADWLKHNDECGCQFRTEYVLNVEDIPEPAELQQLAERLNQRYGAADVID